MTAVLVFLVSGHRLQVLDGVGQQSAPLWTPNQSCFAAMSVAGGQDAYVPTSTKPNTHVSTNVSKLDDTDNETVTCS